MHRIDKFLAGYTSGGAEVPDNYTCDKYELEDSDMLHESNSSNLVLLYL